MSKTDKTRAPGCLAPVKSLIRRLSSKNDAQMEGLPDVLKRNRDAVAAWTARDSEHFSRHSNGQAPEYLWIGCADSRVVPNGLLDKGPGEVFCHRNVGNVVSLSDPNIMSVLEYSIGALKVRHVLVCGHYGCGACNAALSLSLETTGFVNGWIGNIRAVRDKYAQQLKQFEGDRKGRLLCELNALEQARNVCMSQAVQKAWADGQPLQVHCVIYDVGTGYLKVLAPCIDSSKGALEVNLIEDGCVIKDKSVTAALRENFQFAHC